MRGKIVKKDNCLYIRTVVEGDHSDEIELVYYPISITESDMDKVIEGKMVEFRIEIVDYIEVDGLSKNHFLWAVIL